MFGGRGASFVGWGGCGAVQREQCKDAGELEKAELFVESEATIQPTDSLVPATKGKEKDKEEDKDKEKGKKPTTAAAARKEKEKKKEKEKDSDDGDTSPPPLTSSSLSSGASAATADTSKYIALPSSVLHRLLRVAYVLRHAPLFDERISNPPISMEMCSPMNTSVVTETILCPVLLLPPLPDPSVSCQEEKDG